MSFRVYIKGRKKDMKNLIQLLKLKIQILGIQLEILLLRKKLTVPNLPNPRYVVVHHGGGDWGFWKVNDHHKNLWGFKSSLGRYLGYHKWIGFDGKLYIARRDNEEGAHCVDPNRPHYWNKNSIGICLQGNMEEMSPTEPQIRTLVRELDKYKKQGLIIKTHREIVPTICPGQYLTRWLILNI